jgi:hypothetical protein
MSGICVDKDTYLQKSSCQFYFKKDEDNLYQYPNSDPYKKDMSWLSSARFKTNVYCVFCNHEFSADYKKVPGNRYAHDKERVYSVLNPICPICKNRAPELIDFAEENGDEIRSKSFYRTHGAKASHYESRKLLK